MYNVMVSVYYIAYGSRNRKCGWSIHEYSVADAICKALHESKSDPRYQMVQDANWDRLDSQQPLEIEIKRDGMNDIVYPITKEDVVQIKCAGDALKYGALYAHLLPDTIQEIANIA